MVNGVLQTLDRFLSGLDTIMVAFASFSLFLIMILIFFDAIFRYLFNSPLGFTFDMVTLYLMSATLLSVLSYTLRHGGHISIDLFANMMNHRLYLVLTGFSLLASMFVCAIIAWQIALLAFESWELNEVMTGVYAWPLWIGKAIVAMSFAVLTARLFHAGLSNFLAGILDQPELEIAIMHNPTDPDGEI